MFASRIKSLIATLLLAVLGTDARVITRGYPGANTAELDAKFDAALAVRPRVIVVFAGANDALNPPKFLAPQTSAEHLQAMVTRAKAAGVQVVLVTVHDPDTDRLLSRHKSADYGAKTPVQRIAEVNGAIRDVARKNGVPLVDFHAVLQEHGGATPELSTDGVHLTRRGYGLLAAAIHAQLPALGKDDKVVCFGDSLTYGIGVRAGDAPENGDTYPAQLGALLEP